MFKFSFRREKDKNFKHIAHGLIPAASIAPKAAVPRTPPPRSPNPSPERPRSALAAAILSSSLTGQTWALPPTCPRAYSESDQSESFISGPKLGTGLYTRGRWSEEDLVSGPHLSSPNLSEDELNDSLQEGERGEIREEEHVYQSLGRQEDCSVRERVDVQPLGMKISREEVLQSRSSGSEGRISDGRMFGAGDVESASPQHSQMPARGVSSPDISKETRSRSRVARKKKSADRKSSGNWREAVPSTANVMNLPPVQRNPTTLPKLPPHRSEDPCNIYSEVLKKPVQGHPERKMRMADDQKHLEERLQRLELEITHSKSFSKSAAGSQAELQSLRQHAQELVDENDGLKLMVHRLNVELSDYQARFRPRSQQESSKPSGLTQTGSPPHSLFDMKYISPLFLAYDDKINEKNKLLLTAEEEEKKLRIHGEEVIKENEKLHEKISKLECAVKQNDCHQLQQQALRVLEENQVLVDKLDAKHVKAKASHSRHQSEVTKVSKQLMLLEAEKQQMQEELEESRREVQRDVKENEVLRSRLKDAISWDEHRSTTQKLRRQLEQQQSSSQMKKDELFVRVSRLQEENKGLAQDKANLTAKLKTSQAELELSKQGNRKAERRLSVLKRQKEEFLLEEERSRHHLSAVVSVAENISLERDHLLNMASVLQKEKQRFMGKMMKGTVRYGKLEEEVKVYRRQASKRLTALEEAAEGRTASHRREILHLQRLLRERQEAEEKLLQSKREVQEELEVVWQAAIRENQRMKDDLMDSKAALELQGWTVCGNNSSDCMAQPVDANTHPELQQKHGLDFYC